MKRIKIVYSAISEVLNRKKYLLMAALFFLAWVVLGLVSTNATSVINSLTFQASLPLRLELLYRSLALSLSVYNKAAIFFLLATAVLVALNVTMLVYKTKKAAFNSAASTPLGIIGMFTGTLSSTCAACATSLLSILGLSGAILALPFQGAEIGVLTLALLSFSLYKISEGTASGNICKPFKKTGARN